MYEQFGEDEVALGVEGEAVFVFFAEVVAAYELQHALAVRGLHFWDDELVDRHHAAVLDRHHFVEDGVAAFDHAEVLDVDGDEAEGGFAVVGEGVHVFGEGFYALFVFLVEVVLVGGDEVEG